MDDQKLIRNKLQLVTYGWFLLITQLAVFFLIAYYYLTPKLPIQSKDDFNIVFLYLSYLVAIISVPGIYKIYAFRKKKLDKQADLNKQLDNYSVSSLIKYAVLEFAALLLLAAFYMNGLKESLYMFGIVFVTALLNKPSVKQFTADFLTFNDDNVIEEIVYMPDEINENTEDSSDHKPDAK